MGEYMTMLGSMSGQASIVIIVILIIRKILEKLHVEKKYMMLLWGVPFVCLICPWRISVPYGFWEMAPVEISTETTVNSEDIYSTYNTQNQSDNTYVNEDISYSVNEKHLQNTYPNNRSGSYNKKLDINSALAISWVIGILSVIAWNVISYYKFKSKLIGSIKIDENVYQSDEIITPMVVGILKPRVFIPSGMPNEYEKYVIAHERTHIRRFDVVFKLLAYGITCVHWFNPIAWLAFYLFSKDMEMCCDEETVRLLGIEERQAYATALLGVASHNTKASRIIYVAPIAFKEGNVKERIKNVLQYKKTITIVVICVVGVCIICGAIFMTSKEQETTTETIKATEPATTKAPVAIETPIATEAPLETAEPVQVKYNYDDLENRQIINREFASAASALDIYWKILLNKASYIDAYSNEVKNITELNSSYVEGSKVTRFAVIKLDEDDIPEIVVEISKPTGAGGDMSVYGYTIFHFKNNQVYAYSRSNRSFGDLKIDGTYSSSGGASNHGICKIIFNGSTDVDDKITYVESSYISLSEKETKYYVNKTETTAEEFDVAMAYHTNKPNVTWYSFSEDSINSYFQGYYADSSVTYPDNEMLQFSDLEGMTFMHSSGAGGWSTVVYINSDGTFTGEYHDSDTGAGNHELYPRGTRYQCSFSGQFYDLTRIGPYEYSFKCLYISTEDEVGEERIEDGLRIITTEAYGLENAKEIRLYLPGKAEDELPEGFLAWAHGKASSGQLECYGLYNVNDERGYVVW